MQATNYGASNSHVGIAVLICIKEFDNPKQWTTRNGADEDINDLETVLTGIGFRVEKHFNKTYIEIQQIMTKVAEADHSKFDCFLCIVSSHGDWIENKEECNFDTVISKDGNPVGITAFIDPVNDTEKCPSLIGKPKIFLIQCCRGMADQGAVDLRIESEGTVSDASVVQKFTDTDSLFQSELPYMIPIKIDNLLHFATTPGFVSYRECRTKATGTWFLQAWCDAFKKILGETGYNHKLDILSMATIVNQEVAESIEMTKKDCKQMPQFVSMLTKDMYLTKKAAP